MAQVNWIKVSVDLFEDEKMRLIQALPEGDALTILWVRLLTMAGKTNDSGYVYLKEGTPYTPQMLSIIWAKPQPVVDLAIKTFIDFGMIEIDGKGIYICNWDKHQNIDGLDKIKKQTNERVKRYRERKKQEQQSLEAPKEDNEECNVTVTYRNATEENRKEKSREEEKEEEKEPAPISKKKRPKENLSSPDEVKTFVEKQMLSNPLPVDRNLLIKFIDCLRLARKNGRVSASKMTTEWEKWSKYPTAVITYAMWSHTAKHDDKREEYTLGIMRNTKEHEASRKLMILQNKQQEGTSNDNNHSGYSNEAPAAKPVTKGKTGWLNRPKRYQV